MRGAMRAFTKAVRTVNPHMGRCWGMQGPAARQPCCPQAAGSRCTGWMLTVQPRAVAGERAEFCDPAVGPGSRPAVGAGPGGRGLDLLGAAALGFALCRHLPLPVPGVLRMTYMPASRVPTAERCVAQWWPEGASSQARTHSCGCMYCCSASGIHVGCSLRCRAEAKR